MHPQPIISLGGGKIEIYLYGVCMAVGIIACFVFLMYTMWKKNFNDESTDKILLIGIFGTGFGILSAALFQGLYNYIDDPAGGFNLSGMTFIGGLIGGVVSFLAVYWLYVYVIAPAAKKSAERRAEAEANAAAEAKGKKPSKFLATTNKILQNNMNATLTDALPFIPIGIAIAHAFGRLGCFFGGCCYGKPDPDFGLACADGFSNLLQMNMTGVKVVPLQLFEMSFLLALAGAMAFLYFRYKFTYNFGLYAIAYGIWRFVIEFYRGDDRGRFLGTALAPSQIWSIVMVLAGAGYFFLQYYVLAKHMKRPELQPSVRKKKDEGGDLPENGETVEAE